MGQEIEQMFENVHKAELLKEQAERLNLLKHQGHDLNNLIMNIYYYLYFRIYCFLTLLNKKNNVVEHSSLLAQSILLSFNILTLLGYYKLKLDLDFRFEFRQLGYLIAVIVIIMNYFIFFRRGKYKYIIKEYKARKYEQSTTGGIWVVAYIVLTFYFSFSVMGDVRKINLKENDIQKSF